MKTGTLTNAPYSPDTVSLDFYLSPKMKKVLKGKRFADIDDVKRHVTAALAGIRENELKRASNNGMPPYASVLKSKESTLMQGKVSLESNQVCTFYRDIPVTFGSPLRRRTPQCYPNY
uniref:Uncharacterized protein n=1 Tax=Cacopsylla melanoneura TaxID=428564 RepID=A0A8D9A836_9HEMI